MKRFVATLALAVALVTPMPARAGEMWDAVKDEWEYRPWALFLAAPAFLLTSPFMLVKLLMDKLAEEDDE